MAGCGGAVCGNESGVETATTHEALTIHVGCTFDYQTQDDVPAVCIVRPAGSDHARLLGETWITTPPVAYHDYVDLFGNVCRRLTLPAGRASLSYDARVVTSSAADPADFSARQMPVQDLPDDVLAYTLPSRFCLSDALYDRAPALFGTTEPGWARVQSIVDYVHTTVRFGYQSTAPTKTSSDVLDTASGVCRDFAHTAIAFCRALSIPARYAFGYLPDIDVPPPDTPMDFCAWFEAFLDGRWWTFDPRNNQRRRGRIVIARGRDAADVPMMTTFGTASFQRMTVWAEPVAS
jgi:transglutaminase-like putative cysteine protease